ncbi:hypothetical protein [Veronia pacifica]|nr:hypothetical protein [Veronia pacifica]
MIKFTKKYFFPLLSLLLISIQGCGGGDDGNTETPPVNNGNTDPSFLTSLSSYAFDDDSRETEILIRCARAFLSEQSCNLSEISPIGAGTLRATIPLSSITNRLLVSHSWMADSFIETLETIDNQELLNMFGSVNTIVISHDVLPSFYSPRTGSVYLNPSYLWRNVDEWATIDKKEDPRTDYGRELQMMGFSRFIDPTDKNRVTTSNRYSDENETRLSSEIAPGMFSLLVHELAHANDFLPPNSLLAIPNYGVFTDYLYAPNMVQNQLKQYWPLRSTTLKNLASVMFEGKTATDRLKEVTPLDAGRAFSDDGAAMMYGYSYYDSYGAEDVATLLEEVMMWIQYGAVSDVAFVRNPKNDSQDCADYVVKWGQRVRLADQNVRARADFVAQQILGRSVFIELQNLPAQPIELVTETDWCSSRTETDTLSQSVRTRAAIQRDDSGNNDFLDDYGPRK